MGRFHIPLLAIAAVALPGCGRPPANSAAPEFATAESRVKWVNDRASGRLPSAPADAQFWESESKIPHGHMGPGYSMFWLNARIAIDPADAPAWAARVKEARAPTGWAGKSNPLSPSPKMNWGMTPGEFAGARWYDPTGLFSKGAHSGYIAGHLAITADGSAVFVWQHWR